MPGMQTFVLNNVYKFFNYYKTNNTCVGVGRYFFIHSQTVNILGFVAFAVYYTPVSIHFNL